MNSVCQWDILFTMCYSWHSKRGTNLGNYQQINIKGTSKRNKENVYAQFSHKRKWNLVICINIIEFNKNTLYEKRQINIAHKNEF